MCTVNAMCQTSDGKEVMVVAPKILPPSYAVVVNGKRLADRRIELDLTYRALAAKVGAPGAWSSLRRLELPAARGGRHTLTLERAVRIAEALEIPPHHLHKYFVFRGAEASAA